jgi:predicted nucleotidyltransferase
LTFDPEPYAAGIRAANEAERDRIRARLALARAEARRLAATMAAADPGIRRVLLFGSVATGRPSRELFDIDIALDGGDLYTALDLAEASDFKVDVLSLDLLPAGMRAAIEGTGIELFPAGAAEDG